MFAYIETCTCWWMIIDDKLRLMFAEQDNKFKFISSNTRWILYTDSCGDYYRIKPMLNRYSSKGAYLVLKIFITLILMWAAPMCPFQFRGITILLSPLSSLRVIQVYSFFHLMVNNSREVMDGRLFAVWVPKTISFK